MRCYVKTFIGLQSCGKRVSFEYLEKLYKLQNDKYDVVSRGGLRVTRKWTHAHIYPNSFQKMQFFFAAQVLSKSASDAIGYFHYDAGEKYEMQFNASQATANYILLANNWFDASNARFKGKGITLENWETNKKVVTNI